MKTSSGYQLEIPMQKVVQASYQMNINTSFLMNINTYIMKKLTNVSPFLLLLIPVFMLMLFTVTTNMGATHQNEAAMSSTLNGAVNINSQVTK